MRETSKMKLSWVHSLGALALISFADLDSAMAQDLFEPVILVNEDGITGYELNKESCFFWH